jgi:response regulator RpfG family c-di-GMP phosphodiesterase
MSNRVLIVDDDNLVLAGYRRQLRGQYEVETALGAAEGMEILAEHEDFAVVVSDLRMPVVNGIEFLSQVRQHFPLCVRVMLTGNADLDSAIEAINEGAIFRFLTKPCPPETICKVLDAAIEQYRLVIAERELLEKTLNGSIQLLGELLALASPVAYARASRVKQIVRNLAATLGLAETWQYEIAAMLCQIGCVAVPDDVLDQVIRGDEVAIKDKLVYLAHPQQGRDLINHIPRLEGPAQIILYQHKHFDGSGYPQDSVCGPDIPYGARLLAMALEYDRLLHQGMSRESALAKMRDDRYWYDPDVLDALAVLVNTAPGYVTREVPAGDLQNDMVLAEAIYTASGTLVVAKGLQVTPSLKARLLAYQASGQLRRNPRVLAPAVQD